VNASNKHDPKWVASVLRRDGECFMNWSTAVEDSAAGVFEVQTDVFPTVDDVWTCEPTNPVVYASGRWVVFETVRSHVSEDNRRWQCGHSDMRSAMVSSQNCLGR
jgi:hypothetical protein